MKQKKMLDDYYNKIAEGYNALYGAEQQKKVKVISRLLIADPELDIGPDQILLDVGCGTGISTEVFQCHNFGLDPSLELLKQANTSRRNSIEGSVIHGQKIPEDNEQTHLGYVQGFGEALPIKDKSCSILICVTALHNFNDIEKGINELYRVTRERAVISILKRAENADEIIDSLKIKFQILDSIDDEIDRIFYLRPL